MAHPIFKLFKKAFYINLDKRPERRVYIEGQLSKIGLEAERFPGIESDNATGHRGCLLSHQALIKKALDENLGSILIIEDDCVFVEDFNERCDAVINDMLSVSPRWDLLYFYLYPCCDQIRIKNISPNLRLIQNTLCTHFYGVNGDSLAKINGLIKNGNEPIDRVYISNDTEIDMVAPMTNLVSQKPGHSDTANNYVVRTTNTP